MAAPFALAGSRAGTSDISERAVRITARMSYAGAPSRLDDLGVFERSGREGFRDRQVVNQRLPADLLVLPAQPNLPAIEGEGEGPE